jgi:hypothetical protein
MVCPSCGCLCLCYFTFWCMTLNGFIILAMTALVMNWGLNSVLFNNVLQPGCVGITTGHCFCLVLTATRAIYGGGFTKLLSCGLLAAPLVEAEMQNIMSCRCVSSGLLRTLGSLACLTLMDILWLQYQLSIPPKFFTRPSIPVLTKLQQPHTGTQLRYHFSFC